MRYIFQLCIILCANLLFAYSVESKFRDITAKSEVTTPENS